MSVQSILSSLIFKVVLAHTVLFCFIGSNQNDCEAQAQSPNLKLFVSISLYLMWAIFANLFIFLFFYDHV